MANDTVKLLREARERVAGRERIPAGCDPSEYNIAFDNGIRAALAIIDAALSASPEEPDVDAQRDLAWGRNAVAFIRERGLEADFNNWCGGWACPVAPQGRQQ